MSENVTPVLKRRVRPWAARPVAFVNLKTREWALEEGGILQTIRAVDPGQTVPLTDILPIALGKAQAVYVVGGWNAESTPAPEWFIAPDGWERVTYHRSPLIAIYKRVEDGQRVTIYSTAQWFGDCGNLATIRAAYVRLRTML